MMFLDVVPANPESQNFKILLIVSEIVIPLIVFVGAYYIFKPLIDKNKNQKNDNYREDTLD
ncbi:MAG: hypothetical protein H6607_04210 [Flavobacteriales bacterium]|nr:hypothetical protein [Flavobacteriales bacterium]